MTLHSNKSSSIFQNGKLKPGIYKIKNVLTQTFADTEEHSKRMCARPLQNLEEGNGLWEVKPLGAGYSVKRVEPGAPDQFCTLAVDGKKYTPLSVSPYPMAWRVEIVNDQKHLGFEYIRLYCENTVWGWVVAGRSKGNGTMLHVWTQVDGQEPDPVLMWKLIPVETMDQGFPPSYEGDGFGRSSTSTQHAESESDDFGTVVTEVTTVTTRRRYRVEGT